MPQAAEPGTVGEPSDEVKNQLNDPNTMVAVLGVSGEVVGLARLGSFDLQAGDLDPAALERRMSSLVPVEDRCGVQVGWTSFRGREYFTLAEVAEPGFDVGAELQARGVPPFVPPGTQP